VAKKQTAASDTLSLVERAGTERVRGEDGRLTVLDVAGASLGSVKLAEGITASRFLALLNGGHVVVAPEDVLKVQADLAAAEEDAAKDRAKEREKAAKEGEARAAKAAKAEAKAAKGAPEKEPDANGEK